MNLLQVGSDRSLSELDSCASRTCPVQCIGLSDQYAIYATL